MADINIDAAAINLNRRGMRQLVFVSANIGYFFFIDGDNDFYYKKTTNGGQTWGSLVAVSGSDTLTAFDVWYDQWTPGDTGRMIHIWYFGTATNDDVLYRNLNTTNDSLLSAVTVFLGSTAVSGRGTFVSGTKARGGNLYCNFNIDAFAETGFYRSVDNGTTWATRTNPLEANLDQTMLFPALTDDPQDIWMLYDDDSTTELTVKTYDDSGNSHAESSALVFDNQATDLTGQYGFSGSIRHSDNHLIFSFFNAYDAAGTDFLCYDWDGTTATKLTDLTTNIDDMYFPSVFLNQDKPDEIYIAYVGKSDGLETLGTTNAVYYARSTDRGLTWTKDIAYSTSSTDYICTWAPLNGERFMVAWQDISSSAIVTNQENSKEFGFTQFNNYQSPRSTKDNTGIMSIGGMG